MKTAQNAAPNGILDRFLNPLSESLTPAMAKKLADFRADAATQSRAEELAEKCSEGELSPSERSEYEAYVRAVQLIAILQSKARLVLAKSRKTR